MSKSKGKGGTGRGTDKKGWTRWDAKARRAKSAPKPYTSKGTKKASEAKVEGQGKNNDATRS
ncbi:DUF3934 family protein [Paenibacillus chibensis]|uniref:DUF3934 family protein n=1 Tax=Paenibacillus chibensis TaxID=59846 RepID=A0ABU6PYN0_9BACL|nr:DUF3934 family protein [Paenibacillus chibensis]MEC0373576.1 DUF3934 family protein [Paenibacillus chibensis]MED5019173.1 DUF3934 family protein [Paenibacillus chibensis]